MEDDWNIECSDDELKDSKGPWEPNPEEIDRLYTMLENGEMQELIWKCPGYRSPSPEATEEPDQEDDNKESEEPTDFDFMDEVSSPKLKIRNKGEETLKGSAKKKTTSLDSVLNNMRRHNLLPNKAKN
ncbi:PAXIP1-associated glutamate-rich protein 1 [Diorhabda carinulata]|uniref:PAXIP1-associated glutamate-rich protein 1 n=1 Tax=Diorhabda sublineata TaxID=1163346 RepID=UPI0024E12652|nr:PAXIP1-associated glutamate-rich protein 1 [Diorhabda sublineata]XP_057651401.1 PAXIP1-associated glutamate-rich protein 1 [Diorhabda carinulata]